ncbi:hypothetical protein SCLCIDRAFT_561069 [Scleroderma citrinum Foug A]|uniref:Uncharacterized protein n=1 Tax=Scleroderma citrinum Foug A TaxID=1036808 RepID=A0A0C3EAU1_9AGAM|nr:hypothetical protein SCLCIDRAFT_561069 [Scleroderma citrinum Foug A]
MLYERTSLRGHLSMITVGKDHLVWNSDDRLTQSSMNVHSPNVDIVSVRGHAQGLSPQTPYVLAWIEVPRIKGVDYVFHDGSLEQALQSVSDCIAGSRLRLC